MNAVDSAEVPKELTYCSDEPPGLKRTASGEGFAWHDQNGDLLRDARGLDRLRALAIPPAWTDVCICPRASGRIQASGRDAKGAKRTATTPTGADTRRRPNSSAGPPSPAPCRD